MVCRIIRVFTCKRAEAGLLEGARMGTTTRGEVKLSARQRLLAAADELFYAEGVHTVGIDRVIEHAGVAKGSLYKNFGGKEGLVHAYLESRHEDTFEHMKSVIDRYDDPQDRLLAVFEAQGEAFAQPDFNGCAFVAASAEAPAGGLVEQASNEFRTRIREILAKLAVEAGVPDPGALAVQLHLLYDGAGVAARMDRSAEVARAARSSAAALLDTALAGAGGGRAGR
jgi:AcrR family transcriptional regulator